MRWRVGLIAAVSLLAAVVAACGVSGSSDFQSLDPDDLANSGLLDTTTTASTTTTTSTTIAPTTAPPATITTIAEPTTTVALEPVPLYFVAGTQLQPIIQSLPRPVSAQQVLTALAAGPPEGDAGVGLRSALSDDLVRSVTENRGVAIVDLLESSAQQIPSDQLPLALGQIVLSLELRGIGAVRFLVNGVDIAVPKGDGSFTTAGEPVTFDDYRSLTT